MSAPRIICRNKKSINDNTRIFELSFLLSKDGYLKYFLFPKDLEIS